MSAVVLASGVLHKKPERKTSKSGNGYVAATLRVREADARYAYWRMITFDEAAQAELLRLDEGDTVSVQGLLRAEIYTPEEGAPRLSMNVIVDQALAAKPKPRSKDVRRHVRQKKARPANLSDCADPDLNDQLPW